MKTTHTPGPWIAKHFKVYPKNDMGDKLHICNTLVCGDVLISGIAQGVNSKAGDYLKEWEANARLIAAAPELLEALNDLVDQIVSKRRDQISLDKAFGAIAKAEGGQE